MGEERIHSEGNVLMATFLPESFCYPEQLWYCMKVGCQVRAWHEDPGLCPCLSTGKLDQIKDIKLCLTTYEIHWYFMNLADSLHVGQALEGTAVF